MTEFISRDEWGARPPRPGPGRLTPSRVRGVALHWPATRTRLDTIPEVSAALRSWQTYHMETHGWSDIAYQLAVDQRGNVYRLRGLRTQSGANGDTEQNETYGAFLLVLAIGEKPTPAMVAATQRRIARFREVFPKGTRIVGHQDIRPEPTSCPGPAVMGLIHAGRFRPGGR